MAWCEYEENPNWALLDAASTEVFQPYVDVRQDTESIDMSDGAAKMNLSTDGAKRMAQRALVSATIECRKKRRDLIDWICGASGFSWCEKLSLLSRTQAARRLHQVFKNRIVRFGAYPPLEECRFSAKNPHIVAIDLSVWKRIRW